jgi:hypothetical protein
MPKIAFFAGTATCSVRRSSAQGSNQKTVKKTDSPRRVFSPSLPAASLPSAYLTLDRHNRSLFLIGFHQQCPVAGVSRENFTLTLRACLTFAWKRPRIGPQDVAVQHCSFRKNPPHQHVGSAAAAAAKPAVWLDVVAVGVSMLNTRRAGLGNRLRLGSARA